MNRLKIRNLIPYLLGGIAMWYFMLHSGVHATISGVLLAFAIPFGNGKKKSSSYILQHYLHWPVAFVILPLFALANTAIDFPQEWISGIVTSSSIGVFAGLVLGKPLGIFIVTFLSVSFGLCKLPEGIRWKHIIGAGMLAGIGFTMSIFITLLAFENQGYIIYSKIAILISSLVAAIAGLVFLRFSQREQVIESVEEETTL
jgi:NhaA family Na+:H+ antiporter